MDMKVSRCLSSIQLRMLVVIIMCGGKFGANGQINTPCTNSIVSSFTPCFNFITGSSANGSSPTQECCDSLKSVMTNMIDCACLIVTGNVPVSIPFIRSLILSLPLQQCNSGVPVQCKGSGVSLPPPGPAVLLAPSYNSPPAYSPRPHHHRPAHPHRPHPPAHAPHSSRALKETVAPSPTVEPPTEKPAAPSPPPAVEQPKRKPASNSSPAVEALPKDKGETPAKPTQVFNNKSPEMGTMVNPSTKAANANYSSHVSSSSLSLWLFLFVVFAIFIC